ASSPASRSRRRAISAYRTAGSTGSSSTARSGAWNAGPTSPISKGRSMTSLSRRFAVFLVALAFAGRAPVAFAHADSPPLWRSQGAKGAKGHLFGSFHLLPPSVKWRTRQVERALAESKVVVLELDPAVAGDQQVMLQLVMKYGVLQPGETLAAVLP